MRQRRDEAKVYLEEDRQALQEAAKENGVAAFTFDANNNITNYDEIMNGLYAELKAAQDAAGPTTDENEQKKIDAIQERIDVIKEAIVDGELFEGSKDLAFDKAAKKYGAAHYLYDGVHPDIAGGKLIAEAWLKVFKALL